MAGPEKVTGMVLSAMSVGEYDRRIVLLTTDRGKISGFARGAKKAGSGLTAAAQPFVFGEFMVYQGKSSYTFVSAKVSEYFAPLREDMEALFKVNPMKVDMILGHLSNRLRRLSLDYVKACAKAAEDA